MRRKPKPPPKKPSKAYLVSFGDTMTALLAFFIVLNSLAKDQTGANMQAGTGSFVAAMKSVGTPGRLSGDRSDLYIARAASAPIYAVPSEQRPNDDLGMGADDEDDKIRIISREMDNFQRFLSEMQYQFDVSETSPTQSQIVFDSFEKLGRDTNILGANAIQLAADAIGQLASDKFELEVIVWANMPSESAINRAMEQALKIEAQIDSAFNFRGQQRQRFSASAKTWLFVDAKRPKISFILSRLDKGGRK
jgi:hypothetical protein